MGADKDNTVVTSVYYGGSTFGKPDYANTVRAMPPIDWYTLGKYKKCYDYLFLVLDDKVSCIIGIDLDANKLAVTYTSSYTKGRAPSLVAKALIYLVQKAYVLGYGLDVPAKVIPKESVALAELYSMKKHGSSFRIEYKDLQKALGKDEV